MVRALLLLLLLTAASASAQTATNSQVRIATTGTAVCLPSAALIRGTVLLLADSTNAAALTVGASSITNTADGTGNGYVMKPGRPATVYVSNASQVCINGTAGDFASYVAY